MSNVCKKKVLGTAAFTFSGMSSTQLVIYLHSWWYVYTVGDMCIDLILHLGRMVIYMDSDMAIQIITCLHS